MATQDAPVAGPNPGRLDRFQRRHPAVGFPLAVFYKYFDDFGPYLAGLLTYYAFVSLFPLLLLASTILGFVLAGNTHLQQEVLDSALHQFPVIGNQLSDPKGIGGGVPGLIIGIIGALYGCLGIGQGVQYAMNTAWRVPRNSRPNPFKARGRSMLLLAIAGTGVLITTGLSILAGGVTASLASLNSLTTAGVLAGSFVVNAAVFLFVFLVATTRELTVRDVAPGAIGSAVAWQLLQSFGIIYVRHVVSRASSINGVFALVLGMLAFFYVTATAILLCVEVNVVRVDRLYPRSLLTPFTDKVQLTESDRKAYTDQARADRSKGFEEVDVRFRPPPTVDSADDPPASHGDSRHGS